MNKILVFGPPRTATTQIQTQLCYIYRLENLIEPFNDPSLGFNPASANYDEQKNPYKWIAKQNNCSIKLLATQLNRIDLAKLMSSWNPDAIVVTDRKNLTNCCLSLWLAEQRQQYHYQSVPVIEKFWCDPEFVKPWKEMYQNFVNACNWLDSQQIKYVKIYYEDYTADQTCVLNNVSFKLSERVSRALVDAQICYEDLCINYKEIEELINHG